MCVNFLFNNIIVLLSVEKQTILGKEKVHGIQTVKSMGFLNMSKCSVGVRATTLSEILYN